MISGQLSVSSHQPGQVLPFRPTRRTIERLAAREARLLYRLTAGFADPCPPDPETRRLFEEGMVEL